MPTGAGIGGWECTGAGEGRDGGARVWVAAGSGAEVVARGVATGSARVGSAFNIVLLVLVGGDVLEIDKRCICSCVGR